MAADTMRILIFVLLLLFVQSPVPDRIERSSVATLSDFFDEVSKLLCDLQRFVRANDIQVGTLDDHVVTTFQNALDRLHIVMRHVGRIRERIPTGLYEPVEQSLLQVVHVLRHYIHHSRTDAPSQPSTAMPDSHVSSLRVPSSQPGASTYDITAAQLNTLLSLGFSVTEIARGQLLGTTCRQTLYNHMSRHSIPTVRQRYTQISEEDLRDVVAGINVENPNSGSGEVSSILQSRNDPIITQRRRVRAALRDADPVGTASRWSRVIQRRRYSVPSPNAVWHLDTNHALRRWRFVVHGGIDGFSRLVTFLRASSNNRAETSLIFFLRGVEDHGLPSRIRTDNGGEYVHVRRFMDTELGPNRGSAISGQSIHNQRIERLWRDVFTKVLDKFYKLFYHMEDHKLLDINNEMHIFALHHIFLRRIDSELIKWASVHNHHKLRTENNKTPLQLWYAGVIQQSCQQSTAIRNIFGSTDNSLGGHNTNWDLSDPETILTIPNIVNPLNDVNFRLLQDTINVLGESTSYGMDIYVEVLQFIIDHT